MGGPRKNRGSCKGTIASINRGGKITDNPFARFVSFQGCPKCGQLINISSIVGFRGASEATHPAVAYSAGKAAMINLTRNLAVKLAAHNIRVNGIAPASMTGQTLVVDGDQTAVRSDTDSQVQCCHLEQVHTIKKSVAINRILIQYSNYAIGGDLIVAEDKSEETGNKSTNHHRSY